MKFIVDEFLTFPMVVMFFIGSISTLIISNKIDPFDIPTYILAVIAILTLWHTHRVRKVDDYRVNKEREDKHIENVNKILYKFAIQKGHLANIYKEYYVNKDDSLRHAKIQKTILEDDHYDVSCKVKELAILIEVINVNTVFKVQFSNKKYTYFLGCISDRNNFIRDHLESKVDSETHRYTFDNSTGNVKLLAKLKSYTDSIYDAYEAAVSSNNNSYHEISNELLKKYPHRESDILLGDIEVY